LLIGATSSWPNAYSLKGHVNQHQLSEIQGIGFYGLVSAVAIREYSFHLFSVLGSVSWEDEVLLLD